MSGNSTFHDIRKELAGMEQKFQSAFSVPGISRWRLALGTFQDSEYLIRDVDSLMRIELVNGRED